MEYLKIQTVFKRDPVTNFRTLLNEYSLPEFEYLKDCVWEFTEKVDGTNIRVIWDCGSKSIRFAGKTDNAQIYPPLLAKLSELFPEPATSSWFSTKEGFPDTNVILFGEGFGARVQKAGGRYISGGVGFVLFDVFVEHVDTDNKGRKLWLKRDSVYDIGVQMNIQTVPVLGFGTLSDMIERTRTGFSSRWGDFLAEGIVARPCVELQNRMGSRVITKIKHKDFGNSASM